MITLDREKRKDGPEFDRHKLKLDPIMGIASAAISVHRDGGQTASADKLMSVFCRHFSQAGAAKAELWSVADMAPATFYRALNELLEAGLVTNTGTDRRPFYIGAGE